MGMCFHTAPCPRFTAADNDCFGSFPGFYTNLKLIYELAWGAGFICLPSLLPRTVLSDNGEQERCIQQLLLLEKKLYIYIYK